MVREGERKEERMRSRGERRKAIQKGRESVD